MAELVTNEAGFKTIKVSRAELIEKLGKFGSKGICDYCIAEPEHGYYVAVLDQWLCPECYERFISTNKPDPRDSKIESRLLARFQTMMDQCKIQ